MSTLDTLRFGTDLDLPDDPDEAIEVTPSGDLPLVTGRTNLRAALRRRFVVAPGTLVHRPEYGGGLPLYIERIANRRIQSQLATALRRNALRDSRIRDATITVAAVADAASGGPGVQVEARLKVAGDQGAESFSLSYS